MATRKKASLSFQNNTRIYLDTAYLQHEILLFDVLTIDEKTIHSYADISSLIIEIESIKQHSRSRYIQLHFAQNDVIRSIWIDIHSITTMEEI